MRHAQVDARHGTTGAASAGSVEIATTSVPNQTHKLAHTRTMRPAADKKDERMLGGTLKTTAHSDAVHQQTTSRLETEDLKPAESHEAGPLVQTAALKTWPRQAPGDQRRPSGSSPVISKLDARGQQKSSVLMTGPLKPSVREDSNAPHQATKKQEQRTAVDELLDWLDS
jgi:hypothetical protein